MRRVQDETKTRKGAWRGDVCDLVWDMYHDTTGPGGGEEGLVSLSAGGRGWSRNGKLTVRVETESYDCEEGLDDAKGKVEVQHFVCFVCGWRQVELGRKYFCDCRVWGQGDKINLALLIATVRWCDEDQMVLSKENVSVTSTTMITMITNVGLNDKELDECVCK